MVGRLRMENRSQEQVNLSFQEQTHSTGRFVNSKAVRINRHFLLCFVWVYLPAQLWDTYLRLTPSQGLGYPGSFREHTENRESVQTTEEPV